MKARVLLLSLALASAACGAAPLSPRFAPPATPSEAQVAENISRAAPREERPVLVALRADNGALCAWDLKGAALWEQPVKAVSAPLIVGDRVVLQEAEGIVVRDLASGAARLELSGDATLVGADGAGDVLVLSLAYKEGEGTRSEVVFVAKDRVRWEKAPSQPAGTPALVQNQVVLPWGTQHLSVLSAEDGGELARWTFRNLMVGQALVERGAVYVGQLGLLRVDKELPRHQEGALALIGPEKRVLPGQPPMLRDGYAAVAPPGHASHKIKLEWRPSADTPAGVAGNSAVLRFYRVAFGLSAQRDEVTWVRSFEHDLVGSGAQAGGAFLVDDHGTLRFIDAAGATQLKLELGKPLAVASIRPGSFLPAAHASVEPLAGSLHDQLLRAAELDDDRLLPARSFAIQHLARTQDPGVTRELIALCSRKGASKQPAPLSACEELGKREGNAADILEGLRRKASFLEQTAAPPVGALAQAAARMQLKQAGPLILSHAEDPNTAASDLAALFQALETLEYQAAVPQLERFVRLHHAEPAGSDLGPALSAALSVLGNLRAKVVRTTLASVASDAFTLEPVRQKAKDALSVLDMPPPQKEAAKVAATKAKVKEAAPKPEVQTDPRPHALDSDAVQKAFRPLYGALERCLASDPAKPKSARIAMIVAGDGRMEGFLVTPTSLQGCSDAILRTARFPETRLTRQHVIHTVYASEEKSASEREAKPPAATGPAMNTARPAPKASAPATRAAAK